MDLILRLIGDLYGKPTTKGRSLAREALLKKASFRVREGAEKDPLLLQKLFFQAFKRIWKARAPYRNARNDQEGYHRDRAIYDGNPRSEGIRKEYLELFFDERPEAFFAKNELFYARSGMQRLKHAFWTFPLLALLLLPFAFKKDQRIGASLLFFEIVEWENLIRELEEVGVRKLYFFSPYHKDANYLTLLLRDKGIKTLKFPSPGPLSGHNRILIADGLGLSSGYHFEEVEAYRESVLVDECFPVPPERSHEYGWIHFQEEARERERIYLGFYSHAVWLRDQEGKKDPGIGDNIGEKELLKVLPSLLEGSGLQLSIFLHPKEKRQLEASKAYYRSLFGDGEEGIVWDIADPSLPTSHAFHHVDIAVGAYSTILFERLAFGYKTLFFPKGVKGFPIQGTAIQRICPTDLETLSEVVNKGLSKSDEDFFSTFGLDHYRTALRFRERFMEQRPDAD